MHGRTSRHSLALLFLSALAACTDETSCPAGSERMNGVCVDPDELPDATVADAQTPTGDSGLDSSAPMLCYLDHDHDGVGAGEPVPCDYVPPPQDAGTSSSIDAGEPTDASAADAGTTTDAGEAEQPALAPAVVTQTGDCDDFDAHRAPTLSELCDGIDNDCDATVDEDVRNACGGECVRPFEHQPGDACSNSLLGACERAGTYTCQSASAVTCSAVPVTPSSELCEDGVDNDCDGLVDEPDAANASLWYQDCDGDGFAASTTGSVRACTKPANAGTCTWTSVIPQPATRSNWDCDDANPAYSPAADYGFPPVGSTSWDLNCDGQATADPAPFQSFNPDTRDILVCADVIVNRLNGTSTERLTCDRTGDGRWDGCITWVGADGKLTFIPPTTRCPEANTRKVNVAHVPNDPFGGPEWQCGVVTTTAAWPCR